MTEDLYMNGVPGNNGAQQDEMARHDRIHELIIRTYMWKDALSQLCHRTVKGYRGGRHGGVATVTYVRRRVNELQRLVDHARKDGSRKHNTVSPWLRALVLLPVATDFMIVVLFFSVVLNVDLSAPLQTPAEFLTTLVFATIITVGLALTLRWVGIRRRADKNDEGVYDPPDGPRRWVPRLEMLMLASLLVGVASVMLVRVVTDASDAGITLGFGWVVALFLAAVTVALNWIIYLVEFADGSEETHELDHWGKQLGPIEKKEAELMAKIRGSERQIRMARGEFPSLAARAPGSGSNE